MTTFSFVLDFSAGQGTKHCHCVFKEWQWAYKVKGLHETDEFGNKRRNIFEMVVWKRA